MFLALLRLLTTRGFGFLVLIGVLVMVLLATDIAADVALRGG